MSLLTMRGLSRSYGSQRVLQDITLDVGEGVTGLLGANGAGKSTLMKIALGLIAPDAGQVELLGADPRATGSGGVSTRERVGYAPEHDCLPQRVSAAEFVAYLAQVSGLPRAAARSRASDTLRLVGLYEERHRAIATYSTGMRQRVKLAQALVHDPLLVLLDEPTGGLDPNGRRDMLDLIARIGSTLHIGIIMSTHLMGDVERACDSIIVLDGCRIIRSEPVAALTTGTMTVHVDIVDGLEAFIAHARTHGLIFEVQGQRIVVDGATDDDLDIIRDCAVDTGALIHRMVRAHRPLQTMMQPDAESEASHG